LALALITFQVRAFSADGASHMASQPLRRRFYFSLTYAAFADRQLMLLAQRGDQRAFFELHARYVQALLQFFRRSRFQIADAEDLAGLTLAAAHRKIRKCDPAQFRPWLFAQAKFVKLTAWTKRRQQNASALAGPGGQANLLNPPAPQPSPCQIVAGRELVETIRQCAWRLSTLDREILLCRYCEDRSVAQTAARLQIPRGTVGSRTSAALTRLIEEMRQNGYDVPPSRANRQLVASVLQNMDFTE
jgi:RNA polymerase sigma-70 factor (ECF subfamily)